MARRNLGDVLQYFISEDEQREARARAEKSAPAVTRSRALRLCLPAAPERLLATTLALELAGAIALELGGLRVLASAAPSPLLPRVRGVRWQVADGGAEGLAAALGALEADEPALVLARPSELVTLFARVPAAQLEGLLFPVDAAPWGLARALGFLRELRPVLADRRVLALIVAAESPAASAELAARLASAAQRQHGLDVESAGELARNADSFRSLLLGESIQALAAESAPAASLRALSRRLTGQRAA